MHACSPDRAWQHWSSTVSGPATCGGPGTTRAAFLKPDRMQMRLQDPLAIVAICWVDPTRIVVLGMSRGGEAAIAAAIEPLRERMQASDVRFAAHVVIAPGGCNFQQRDVRTTGAPTATRSTSTWSTAQTGRRSTSAAWSRN